MKISRQFNVLHRSTKVTMVVCAVFVIITAIALFMLMLFPIHPKEPETIVLNRHAPVEPTAPIVETEEELPETEPIIQQTEGVHTLSTWSANISGFKQDFNGFNQQVLGITTPEPFPLRTKPNEKKLMEVDVPEVVKSPKIEISLVNLNEARVPEQTITQAIPESNN